MRRLAVLVVTIVAAAGLSLPEAGTAAQAVAGSHPQPTRDRRGTGEAPTGTAIIRGFVAAADTSAPVRRAQVRVVPDGPGGGGAVTQTDAQGGYEVGQLPAGRYTVSVSRTGFIAQSFGQRVLNQPGTPIELADGQVAERVNFLLARGGAITGAIMDEFGDPVAGVQVSIHRAVFARGSRRLTSGGGPGAFDRTDDLGQFRLHGLTPGDYYVSATYQEHEFVSPNVRSTPGPSNGYAPTYYPGTANLADATRVTIRAGAEVQNVVFTLSATYVGRIRGRVVTSQGTPATGFMVMISPSDADGGMNVRGTGVRPDGSFQTERLPPGTYRLAVQQPGGWGPGGLSDTTAPREVGRADVVVSGNDVDNIQIVTGRGGIIRGRIVTDDGSVPSMQARDMRILAQPAGDGLPFNIRPQAVEPDGTFEVSGIMGRVILTWMSSGNAGDWRLKSALMGTVDIADTPVDVRPGQIVEGVEVVLTQQVTEVSGMALDARNEPVLDAAVVVFAANAERWDAGPRSRWVRVTRPDATGAYRVRLTPGEDYLVMATRAAELSTLMDPGYLASAREVATPFSIREGERKTLDVRVRTGAP